MLSKIFSATAAVLAASSLVSAQTFTDCNPTEKTCPNDPALGTTTTVDFTKGANSFFKAADGTKMTYDDSGAIFTINSETDAPTLISQKYIFFGKIDVTLKAAPGSGIITSFVLQSDDLDEIDWEWVGSDTKQVQTNYFGKGDTTTYDRGAFHSIDNPQSTSHTYSIDWTKDSVKWSIDGNLVRTLLYSDAKGGSRFPQTPMQIKLGTWVAGRKDAPEGTVEWGGGYADFSKAPFIASYEKIVIQDYSTGATEYAYGDKTGSYQSIKIIKGDGSETSSTGSPSSASASATTKSGSQSASASGSAVTSGATTLSTITSSASGSGSTVSTASGVPAPFGGSTSAAATTTGSSGSSTGSATSSGASATSTSAPGTSGAFKQSLNLVVMGASLILGLFLL